MSTDTNVTKFINSKRKLTSDVISARRTLQKLYPTFFRLYSGHENSQDVRVLYRMKNMCDILKINFNDVKPIALRFINCKYGDKSIKAVPNKKLRVTTRQHK